jgi:hypothetical protein
VVRSLDLHEAGSYGVTGPLCDHIAARVTKLAEQDIRDTFACRSACGWLDGRAGGGSARYGAVGLRCLATRPGRPAGGAQSPSGDLAGRRVDQCGGLGSGQRHHWPPDLPWPVWVAGPYGAALFALAAAVTQFRRSPLSAARRCRQGRADSACPTSARTSLPYRPRVRRSPIPSAPPASAAARCRHVERHKSNGRPSLYRRAAMQSTPPPRRPVTGRPPPGVREPVLPAGRCGSDRTSRRLRT